MTIPNLQLFILEKDGDYYVSSPNNERFSVVTPTLGDFENKVIEGLKHAEWMAANHPESDGAILL